MIPVTKPYLPPRENFEAYLESIWNRNWLTNNGPLVNELELELKRFLKLKHLLYTANGTIALQIAIKALELKGEIITTPFSYIATTSSIVWEGCTPVFADIDPHTLNIDPRKIESAISPNTSAILATHCFGNPCDVEAIQEIANKYDLKVIYDAAHCFGTEFKGESILKWGDISIISFHATKLFHTVEGGAVITQDPDLLRTMSYQRNFGHDGPEKFNGVGINGKNSEIHAAMGLCMLKEMPAILSKRREQCAYYDDILKGLKAYKPCTHEDSRTNCSYYPIILDREDVTLKMKATLEKKEIFPRRYFFPALSSLDYVPQSEMPVCDDISRRLLCLPLYHGLKYEEQDMIARILLRVQNYG